MSAVHTAVPRRVGFGQPTDTGARAAARSRRVHRHGRSWLVTRALVTADLAGLGIAFAGASLVTGGRDEAWIAAAALPLCVAGASVYGLYGRHQERVDPSSVDDLAGIFQLVTLAAWLVALVAWAVGPVDGGFTQTVIFWLAAFLCVTLARGLARVLVRRSPRYVQNTLVVGAGHVGQLAARKLRQHPEYKLNVVGFVDANPRPLRSELVDVEILGASCDLESLIAEHRVERVIVAFSEAQHDELLDAIRRLQRLDVHIDVVPRLFEIVGPEAGVHTCEGLSLVGLPSAHVSSASRVLKRALDIAVALPMLVLAAPALVVMALAVRLDSPGPVLFRQQRLGLHMRPFTVLKFRTMRVDTDQEEHRRYIEQVLTHDASPNGNGLYKLERPMSVTRVGRFLRRTSLDELPQLLNVLAGDMSLVGPRPCLAYEAEQFADHHYERFQMPPGLTGLWQVTARAKTTFVEALEMDVSYVRGWSLGLDLQLLLKTPLSLVRLRATT